MYLAVFISVLLNYAVLRGLTMSDPAAAADSSSTSLETNGPVASSQKAIEVNIVINLFLPFKPH